MKSSFDSFVVVALFVFELIVEAASELTAMPVLSPADSDVPVD